MILKRINSKGAERADRRLAYAGSNFHVKIHVAQTKGNLPTTCYFIYNDCPDSMHTKLTSAKFK